MLCLKREPANPYGSSLGDNERRQSHLSNRGVENPWAPFEEAPARSSGRLGPGTSDKEPFATRSGVSNLRSAGVQALSAGKGSMKEILQRHPQTVLEAAMSRR